MRDQHALEQLYNNYSGAFFGIIVRIVRDNRVAEELTQEVFLKIWDKIEQYDSGRSSFFTWGSVMARHTAIDKARLIGYQNQQKTDSVDITVHNTRTTSTSSDKIDVELLTKDLDDKYKVLLDKVYLQGYSQRDVADEMDIPLGTVKTRMRKAISILRNNLANEKGLFFGILLFALLMYLLLWH